MTAEIETTLRDGVQTIRFVRPEKKNALTAAMYGAISDALRHGDGSTEVAAHVLVGSGGMFSAGSDVGEFLARAQGRTELSGPILDFVRLLPMVEKPIIAAVDGLAVGIGTTMLFHCDLVYATPAARFRTPFLDLALVPEAGSSLLAPLRMGYARAFELLVLGETFDADRARETGLVNAIVPADQLESTAVVAGRRLAAKPPEALILSRRMMRGDPQALLARIGEEAAAFSERLQSPEAREAFAAFLEKRAPQFGRPDGPN